MCERREIERMDAKDRVLAIKEEIFRDNPELSSKDKGDLLLDRLVEDGDIEGLNIVFRIIRKIAKKHSDKDLEELAQTGKDLTASIIGDIDQAERK